VGSSAKPGKMLMVLYGIALVAGLALLLGAYRWMIVVCPGAGSRHGAEDRHPFLPALEERLKTHVVALAGVIGERSVACPDSLQRTACYLRDCWEAQGYRVESQEFKVEQVECLNLSVEIRGSEKPGEILLVGAHYDSVFGSPGANDNASAIAALLELSRLFAAVPPRRTIRFVAFPNEEPPFFRTGLMGSRVYARRCHTRGEHIVGMVSLETIGYFTDRPGSQRYPLPLGLFYPHQGNFIAIVGNLSSRDLVKRFSEGFREKSDFPLECVATFGAIPGVSWSDHSSFWKFGYPAIMVTDTAPYRYPYYHTAQDTPDKVQYSGLAQVTYGSFSALQQLAN
jgi:hypothetical protein